MLKWHRNVHNHVCIFREIPNKILFDVYVRNMLGNGKLCALWVLDG